MAAASQTHDYLTANHNVQVIAVATIFSALSLACLIARLVSKRVKKQRYTVDDWLLIAACIIAIGESAMIAAATKFGHGGYHQAALSTEDMIALQKAFYASSFLQTTTLALAKVSVLILLYRIFNIVEGFKRTCWILGVIVVCWWAAAFFGGAFICYPASHIWIPQSGGTCGNQLLLDLIVPIPWVLTDLMIFIAPMPVIRKLRLSDSQRPRVYAAFLIGAVTCAVSILRYRSLFYKLDDFSWSIIPAALWNIIELHVTVMCPALMTSSPVLLWIFTALHLKWTAFTSGSWSKFSFSRSQVAESIRSESADRQAFNISMEVQTTKLIGCQNTSLPDFQTVPDFVVQIEERCSPPRCEHV